MRNAANENDMTRVTRERKLTVLERSVSKMLADIKALDAEIAWANRVHRAATADPIMRRTALQDLVRGARIQINRLKKPS